MTLKLSKKIKDNQSYFKNIQDETISRIEININKATFLELNGMKYFFQRLSKFVNLKTFYLTLRDQQISDDCFEQLLLSIQKMENLELFTLNSFNTKISQNQINFLLRSIGGLSFIQVVDIAIKDYKIENEQQQQLSVFKHFEHAKNLKTFEFQFQNNYQKYKGYFRSTHLSIYILDCEVEENEFQHLHQFSIEYFSMESSNSNLSPNHLEYLFKYLASFPQLNEINLDINQKNLAIEDNLSLIKYLEQSKQIKQLKYKQEDEKKYGYIQYRQNYHDLRFYLTDVQINENNTQSFCQFLKSIQQELKIISIQFKGVEIQSKQLGILFSFLKYSLIIEFFLLFSNKKINSEQLQVLGLELIQCKSLENLFLNLKDTELDEQGNDLFSQQLSQLENIHTLRYHTFFDKIDISTSFINEIIQNQSLEKLELGFTPLENHQNHEESMKKLFSMHSLKYLTLSFQNFSQDINIFKNGAKIQQTNLQHLKIQLINEKFHEKDFSYLLANLGKDLKSLTVIRNITIDVYNIIDFVGFAEFFKSLSKAQFYTLNFYFSYYTYGFDEPLEKLKLYCMKNLQKAVQFKFQSFMANW